MHKRFFALLLAVFCLAPQAWAFTDTLPETLIPGGHTVGIRLQTDGVIIIGHSTVDTEQGPAQPAMEAGLLIGDRIIRIDETAVKCAADLIDAVACAGERAEVRFIRDSSEQSVSVRTAVNEQNGERKLGVLVRDGMSGIGTITFYDPASGLFGALGHGVNDVDCGILLPISSGNIIPSLIVEVQKGVSGKPGELRGQFPTDEIGGEVARNTDRGIFGRIARTSILGPKLPKPVPVARPGEVVAGKAEILCNIDGDEVCRYDVEILKVYGVSENRSMLLRVTDTELLEKTGGIVQGMSGSPILQNGKLIGAVTHVLINDPQRGYGIYIDNMLRQGYAEIPDIQREAA